MIKQKVSGKHEWHFKRKGENSNKGVETQKSISIVTDRIFLLGSR